MTTSKSPSVGLLALAIVSFTGSLLFVSIILASGSLVQHMSALDDGVRAWFLVYQIISLALGIATSIVFMAEVQPVKRTAPTLIAALTLTFLSLLHPLSYSTETSENYLNWLTSVALMIVAWSVGEAVLEYLIVTNLRRKILPWLAAIIAGICSWPLAPTSTFIGDWRYLIVPLSSALLSLTVLVLVIKHALDTLTARTLDGWLRHAIPPAMRKFLFRHYRDQGRRAKIVGMRTAEFLVNHDPLSTISGGLPATLSQIRTEEIRRFIGKSLGERLLHQGVLNSKIAGTIDPETSIHPCIESLRLFSSLYLDANQLIEHHLQGIASLLPLLDPELAEDIREDKVETLTSHNPWFFFLDFKWVDQFAIHYHDESQYSVVQRPVESHYRRAMEDASRSFGHSSNVIWLSQGAQQQLCREAQILADILEPFPLQVDEFSDSELYFVVRFELLIPRLQKFYALDRLRQRTAQFEITPHASRIRDELTRKIGTTRSFIDFKLLTVAITSHEWHGFKEKNIALGLLMDIWKHAIVQSESLKSEHMAVLREHLLKAVNSIGYPSQAIHSAQLEKISSRSIARLLATAGSQKHPRFFESWLMLSTRDYTRESLDDRSRVRDFLLRIITENHLKIPGIYAPRVLDCYVELAIADSHEGSFTLFERFSPLVEWYFRRVSSVEHLSYLFDRIQFIEHTVRYSLDLEPSLFQGIGPGKSQTAKIRFDSNDYDLEALHLRIRRYLQDHEPRGRAPS